MPSCIELHSVGHDVEPALNVGTKPPVGSVQWQFVVYSNRDGSSLSVDKKEKMYLFLVILQWKVNKNENEEYRAGNRWTVYTFYVPILQQSSFWQHISLCNTAHDMT